MTPEHVSYRTLEHAPAVLLAGFEPEEESPIVFLRLRKVTRHGRTKVWSVAALASNGLTKLGGTLLPAVPGAEAATLNALPADVTAALEADGAVILVGERLAASPGALSAAAAIAASTGARLAWVPRRAGERGAVDAGALPNLLPGGRTVADAAHRAELEALWGAPVPSAKGHDAAGIWRAAADGALSALVVGGVEPADTADPALAERALSNAGFVVSLEVRRSSVTPHADVVLPVAPVAQKSGRYVTWEGRRRPFELVIRGTGAMSDSRVLNALAEELDVDLALPTEQSARDELLRLDPIAAADRPGAPVVAAVPAAVLADGEAILAGWRELIDAGRMQDGDEHLAGTAKPVYARISAGTAAGLGVSAGQLLAINTDFGSVVAPVAIDVMPDDVVWLPVNARESRIGVQLNASVGDTVRLTRPDAAPAIGVEGNQE